VDESVPYFDVFDYAVYAIINGQHGASARAEKVLVAPTCDWKIIMQSSAFQGWNGGYVSLYSATGKEIQRFTITSSVPSTFNFPVPVGNVCFGWTAPSNNVSNMSLIIKDSEGNTAYTYQGTSSGMEEGVFYAVNNGCGNALVTTAPYHLMAEMSESDVVLTWENGGVVPDYGYIVYKDEQIYGFTTELSFVDENITVGHCYTVTALNYGGESDHSNETCASAGDCKGATNFDYEYVGNNYKIKLLWDKPEPGDGLSGYYLFRKQGEDGTYERIKLLGASATNFTDNTANQQGDYYYRLYAYYSSTDCTSAPASIKDDPNKFYLKVYYSPTDIEETEKPEMKLYPNPVNHSLKIEAEGMTHVTVFNQLGQLIFASEFDSNSLNINVSDWNEGIYLVKVMTGNGWVSHRVAVVH
jgi:hypothetical protein